MDNQLYQQIIKRIVFIAINPRTEFKLWMLFNACIQFGFGLCNQFEFNEICNRQYIIELTHNMWTQWKWLFFLSTIHRFITSCQYSLSRISYICLICSIHRYAKQVSSTSFLQWIFLFFWSIPAKCYEIFFFSDLIQMRVEVCALWSYSFHETVLFALLVGWMRH